MKEDNRKIEELLDRCLDGIPSGGGIDKILKDCPDSTAEEILGLIETSEKLKSLPDPAADIRGAMLALAKLKAGGQSVKKPFPFAALRRAAILIFSSTLLLYAFMSSSVAAPGDILYPLKLITEKAQFFVSIDKAHKTELRIIFSNERLNEAVKKYEKDGKIDSALFEKMLDNARLALKSASELEERKKKDALLKLNSLVSYQQGVMNMLFVNASEKDKMELAPFTCICNKRQEMLAPILKNAGIVFTLPPEQQEACESLCGCGKKGLCGAATQEAKIWQEALNLNP
jgi:hypothetical protein